jgi:hypothetical protein
MKTLVHGGIYIDKGKWVVENVKPYYEPLMKPIQ